MAIFKSPFLGGTYVSRSRQLAFNRAVNIYLELVETKEGRSPGAFFHCPGFATSFTCGTGPVRGAYFASNGLVYVVSGNGLYKVDPAFNVTLLGTIPSANGPVQMVDNGSQLLIVDGSGGFCLVFASGAFTQVLPGGIGVQPKALAYQDGFGLVNFLGTNQFYQSNLRDFTVWQALNFSSADSTPFGIVGMYDLHREVWLFKSDRIEVWVNAGLPGFAFQRLQGVQIPAGCVAPASVSHLGDSIIWLGGDEQGQGIVYMSEGYQAIPVSTHAINHAIQQFAVISDAIAFAYQHDGHKFYVLTFPTGNQTFVFDLDTKLWHERAAFNNGVFNRYAANCFVSAYGQQFIGDYQSGQVFAFSDTLFTDNGNQRRWLRSWRALPPAEELYVPMRFNSLELDMDNGTNVADGLDPQFVLRWSDDGGYNWSSEMWSDGDKTGSSANRIIFQRLGQTKRGGGYDRIFELSGSDPIPLALLNVNVEAEPT